MLDSHDDVPEFLQKSNYREQLFLCSKSQLILIADYFELGVSISDKKGEILLKVIQATQGVTGEDKIMNDNFEFERLQLEKMKLEREREREERGKREKERGKRERKREGERRKTERRERKGKEA